MDLAVVTESSDVVPHIARACGVVAATGRATIEDTIEHLDRGPHLLVIDNCEHVAPAVTSAITALLLSCPNVTVLATSRQPLHIDGEHVHPVDPLPFESTTGSTATRFACSPTGPPQRAVSSWSMSAIEQSWSRRVDGLTAFRSHSNLPPSRLRVLSVADLYERLDKRFELLVDDHTADERHRTLLTTVDWSHELLSGDAQTLLRRLSVFRGSFDFEAIVGVVAIYLESLTCSTRSDNWLICRSW